MQETSLFVYIGHVVGKCLNNSYKYVNSLISDYQVLNSGIK